MDAAELFSVVSKMESLQELDLRRNMIGDLGGLIVLDALKERKEGTVIVYVRINS